MSLNEWHSAKVTRLWKNGTLQVDNGPIYIKESVVSTYRLHEVVMVKRRFLDFIFCNASSRTTPVMILDRHSFVFVSSGYFYYLQMTILMVSNLTKCA